jgi:hypothetical protein
VTLAATALLFLASPAGPTVVAVRAEALGVRRAVTVVTDGGPRSAGVAREGHELRVEIGASLPHGLALPAAVAPLDSIRVERTADGTALCLRVKDDVPYEIRHEGDKVSVVFDEPPVHPLRPSPEIAALYAQVRAGAGPPGEDAETLPPGAAADGDEDGDGLRWGPFSLRPALYLTYMNYEYEMPDGSNVAQDRYLEVRPSLSLQGLFLDGRLRVSYEPRLRTFSNYPRVNETSHLADASFDLTVGPRLSLRLTDHFAWGLLETAEVDPGREYFYRLGRFRHNTFGVSARYELSPRTSLDFGADANNVDFEEPSSYLSYESRTFYGGLSYELTPSTRAQVRYTGGRVPESGTDRPEAVSTFHTAGFSLAGEVLPLVTGEISVGYSERTHPMAPLEGRRFRGVLYSGSLTKAFSPSATAALRASRSTELSGYEQNAFYVSTALSGTLNLPLPRGFAFQGMAGYRWNDYRVGSLSPEGPRHDRIAEWGLGLARPLTRWAFVRADYRRERRYSTVYVFDNTFDAIIVQMGLGMLNGWGLR